jgi:hypothetical protein
MRHPLRLSRHLIGHLHFLLASHFLHHSPLASRNHLVTTPTENHYCGDDANLEPLLYSSAQVWMPPLTIPLVTRFNLIDGALLFSAQTIVFPPTGTFPFCSMSHHHLPNFPTLDGSIVCFDVSEIETHAKPVPQIFLGRQVRKCGVQHGEMFRSRRTL